MFYFYFRKGDNSKTKTKKEQFVIHNFEHTFSKDYGQVICPIKFEEGIIYFFISVQLLLSKYSHVGCKQIEISGNL